MAILPELIRYLGINYIRKLSKKPRNGARQNTYISLTTTPDRIHKIIPTLISLLDQTVPASGVVLNIPKHSNKGIAYNIPAAIQETPNIFINRPEKDFGPATKSLPTLLLDFIPEDALIIVVDDDQIYPKKLVESYQNFHEKYPDKVLTFCGWKVPPTKKHEDRKILRGGGLKIFNPKANIKTPVEVDIIQGVSSYAIQKRFFDDAIFNYSNAPDGALFADDIWISGHLSWKKIPKLVIKPNCSYLRLLSMAHVKTEGLRDTANADNSNNDRLYEYFWT